MESLNHSPSHTASHLRRPESSAAALWEPQTSQYKSVYSINPYQATDYCPLRNVWEPCKVDPSAMAWRVLKFQLQPFGDTLPPLSGNGVWFSIIQTEQGWALQSRGRRRSLRSNCVSSIVYYLCDPLDGGHSAIMKHPVAMWTLWVDSAISCTPCHNLCRSPEAFSNKHICWRVK
jgi:hypothetical protein